MSDDARADTTQLDANGSPPTRMRLRKRRLLLVFIPLALLAVISTAFGMMMAVASELPDLERTPEFRNRIQNTVLTDVRGKRLGLIASDQNRILAPYDDIAPIVRQAVIAVEDRRFFENDGVDLRSIGRALVQDVVQQRAAQGGSTITQQFVKNATRAQGRRTVFEKMREAALAYHLTRKRTKKEILTQYLNSVYFGNGAYGIEAAARTYFGKDPNHVGCGTPGRPCAKELKAHEAALLAAVIASPSAYDPVANPQAALGRRNLVLDKLVEEQRISRPEAEQAKLEPQPLRDKVVPPKVESKAPYFTSWVRQQLVDRYGARRAFEGGLKVQTTLDLDLQQAAQQAVARNLGAAGPSAAVVVIDNDSGEVRAMVGGRNYDAKPFNLATQGQRQPGSSFKPFILAEALHQGIGPGSVWPSRKREFPLSRKGDVFRVSNFEDSYAGTRTLASGLTFSDNAVYAAVGIKAGTRKVARRARRMGIRTPVSTNYAMTLGGLRQGVTPLDMAHAYQTLAAGGARVWGTLGADDKGPVGIREVVKPGNDPDRNERRRDQVLKRDLAAVQRGIMATVITQGSGRRASLGTEFAAGKTGTTENFGDAWFVGFTERYTAAVWVGYPDKLKPMLTEFAGEAVAGGTFPALIWRDFMLAAGRMNADREARSRAKKGLPPQPVGPTTAPAPVTPNPAGATAPSDTVAPSEAQPPVTSTPQRRTPAPAPRAPTPAAPRPKPAPAPSPTPSPPADGGTGGVSPG